MRVVMLSILMSDKYGMSLLHYGTNPTVVVSSSMSCFFVYFFIGRLTAVCVITITANMIDF